MFLIKKTPGGLWPPNVVTPAGCDIFSITMFAARTHLRTPPPGVEGIVRPRYLGILHCSPFLCQDMLLSTSLHFTGACSYDTAPTLHSIQHCGANTMPYATWPCQCNTGITKHMRDYTWHYQNQASPYNTSTKRCSTLLVRHSASSDPTPPLLNQA